MGILSKPLWAVLGLLALGLAISVSGVLYFRGEAKALRVELNAVQGDLKGLTSAYSDLESRMKARAAIDAAQSTVRAKQAKAVRAVRAELNKEDANENASHPVASDSQLDRLRRVADAANAGIRSASKLP